jgi:biopolymer transport protein ExbB
MELTTFLTFVKEHFTHAAPILIVGCAAMAIFLERTYSLFVQYPMLNNDKFFSHIADLVMKVQVGEAVRHCDHYRRKPLANVVHAGLSRAHLPEGLIQDGIQLALQKCSRSILKRTPYLATIANVATLLGLLGTIAGLIQSFEAVAHADAQQKAAMLSAGIATAMNATMLGLGVAIPCMLAYSFLTTRTNNLLSDLEQGATRTMDILKQRYYTSEFVKGPQGGGEGPSNDGDKIRRAS